MVNFRKPVIKILGVGGAGCNTLNNVIEDLQNRLPEECFVALNTDAQALALSKSKVKIQLGENGLGAGANPVVGREAALSSKEDIEKIISEADMVIISAGCGKGTGSGAAPVVAEIAKNQGKLVICLVTKPFSFEGRYRLQIAEESIALLDKYVDISVILSNQKLLEVSPVKTTLREAFLKVDKVCASFIKGIVEIICKPGLVNLDYADISTIMKNRGKAVVGIGEVQGEEAATRAAKMALCNPLLENSSIKGAQDLLVHISSNEGLSLEDIQTVFDTLKEEVGENVKIIYGATLEKDEEDGFVFSLSDNAGKMLRVMIIATGCVPEVVLEDKSPPSPDIFSRIRSYFF